MNATLDTSGLRARAHTAQISTPPRYAHTLCSLLTELTKSTLPIIDSLTVPTRSTGSELTECSKRFLSSWVSTQVSTWGGLLGAPYSCADYLTHPLPRESSPARQSLTLRKAVSRETKPFSSHRTMRRTGQDGRHSHHPSALPQGRGSATHCLRTNCSHPEHRPCAACRRLSQVCWIP